MEDRRPRAARLIGIAGPSGSGKTALAARVASDLAGGASVLSLDAYYLPLDHLPLAERERVNFDHPDSLDWDLFRADLDRLARAEPVDEPVYIFAEHTRSRETRRVEPAPFVIVEGILVLHDETVRARLDLCVYVDTPDAICFERRLERDMRERGRTAASVRSQYETTVLPMARQFVWPSAHWADLVISGTGSLADEAARVVERACPAARF